MNQDTPAVAIKTKDLDANGLALKELLEAIPRRERIQRIVDIRYGLGGWARHAVESFPLANVLGFEQDAETASKAFLVPSVRLLNERFNDIQKLEGKTDLLLADFNTLTVLKRELLDRALTAVNPAWIVFTDVCCSKLHLNYRSYGLENPDLAAYWERFEVGGYRLVKWVKRHHAASSALYQRQE